MFPASGTVQVMSLETYEEGHSVVMCAGEEYGLCKRVMSLEANIDACPLI